MSVAMLVLKREYSVPQARFQRSLFEVCVEIQISEGLVHPKQRMLAKSFIGLCDLCESHIWCYVTQSLLSIKMVKVCKNDMTFVMSLQYRFGTKSGRRSTGYVENAFSASCELGFIISKNIWKLEVCYNVRGVSLISILSKICYKVYGLHGRV
jgi:hypothetical protein